MLLWILAINVHLSAVEQFCTRNKDLLFGIRLQFVSIFWGHDKHHHFPPDLAGCLQIILYGRLAQQVAT